MINIEDLYTHIESVPIKINGVELGTLMSEYQVQAYTEMRNLTRTRAYLVSARLRIIVPSEYKFNPSSISAFENYPAAINNSIKPINEELGLEVELLDYSPKTLNTTINTSQNSSRGETQGYMSQQSVGSSTSETHSFEVSGQAGFVGKVPTGSVSAGYGYSNTDMTSTEETTGKTSGQEIQTGMATSMSIKDWGSYASLDNKNQFPTWLWGQEFPWSVLDFHNVNPNTQNVILPDFIKKRLYDKDQVFPPSQLALYGVNFQANAKWLIRFPRPNPIDETLIFKHELNYFTATHQLEKNELIASINNKGKFRLDSKPINLPLMGLDPIINPGVGNGAVVGFAMPEFLLPPSPNSGFRVISGANNLYVTGTGFNTPSSPDDILLTNFPAGEKVQINIQFKIMSPDQGLSLFLKHWKTTERGCQLRIEVNGNAANSILRTVDAVDAGSGSNNIDAVILRNKDYDSKDYFNYLVMGLNTISITLTPAGDGKNNLACGYAIRALAIG